LIPTAPVTNYPDKMPGSTKTPMLAVTELLVPSQIVSRKSPVLKSRKVSVGAEVEAIPLLDATGVASDSAVAVKPAVLEPLLQDNPNRHVIFPIEHADVWLKYKQHMSVFWIPEEIDLSKDMNDWV